MLLSILPGRDAVDMGLIDEIGGLREALGKLKELSGENVNK